MSRIKVDLHKNWMKDATYRREHKALEKEFLLVNALIQARARRLNARAGRKTDENNAGRRGALGGRRIEALQAYS
jgi:hypothetical protein